ncbi:PGF-pre-PGF domain-containing protein, partial [Candidatus Woesearchaeota archaeon]|nr:PGF-pre-PGF domain-containing protein [Candidatus Woesearchaeota archaeon]
SSDGNHSLVYFSVDNVGNVEANTTVYALLDTTDPQFDSLGDPVDQLVTNITLVSFGFMSSDLLDASLTYTLFVDGAATATTGATSNVSWTNFSHDFSVHGMYNWTVQVADDAGNAVNSTTRYLAVDTAAPDVPVINSPANESWTDDDTPEINFTLTDDVDDNLTYHVFINGVSSPQLWALNGTPTVVSAAVSLPEGPNEVVIQATDDVGQSTNSSLWVINIDTVMPVVTLLLSPVDGLWLNETNVTFSFNSSDNLDGELNYTLFINDTNAATGVTAGNGTPTEFWAVIGGGDGWYSWLVQVVDEAGNAANYSSSWTFGVDTVAPSTSNDAPAGWVNDPFNVTLTPVDAGSGMNATRYSLDGSALAEGEVIPIVTDGNHTIVFFSVDNVGNVEANKTVYALLDATVPSVILGSPANSATESSTTVGFSFNSSDVLDGDGVLNYTLFINGTANNTGVTTGNKSWTNFSVSGFESSTTYSWLVQVEDEAGNKVNSSERTFSVAIIYPTSAPELTSAVDSDTDGNVYLAWAADPEADYYRVYRDSSEITDASGLAHLFETADNTTLSYIDNTTTNGTTYWYAVTTVFTGGIENQSVINNSLNVTPEDAVLPESPDNVAASTGADGSVTVTWDAVVLDVDGGSETVGNTYRVFRTTNASSFDPDSLNASTDVLLTTTGGLTYTDTAMTTGTNYTYVVTSLDDGANHNGNVSSQNSVAIEPSACTTSYSYGSWSSCIGGSQSRTGTRTCYGGGDTTDTQTQSCSSSSGGSSGTWSPPNPRAAKVFAELNKTHPAVMKVTDEEFGLTTITITVQNPVKNVEITVEKLDGKPASVTHEVQGKVYRYLELKKRNLADADMDGNARIAFKVSKEWMNEHGFSPGDVALLRYTDRWEELVTRMTGSDPDNLLFEAEVPGFSYFAIGEKSSVTAAPAEEPVAAEPVAEPVAPADEDVPAPQPPMPPPAPSVPDADVPADAGRRGGALLVWVIGGMVLVALVVAFLLGSKKESLPPPPERHHHK